LGIGDDDRGAVVVLDARNGDIVALASAPTFDISKFTNGIPADEYARLTGPDSNNPLVDRAVQGQYAPGSTFKMVTAYAAMRDQLPMEEGQPFDDTYLFYDKGYLRFGATGQEREFQNAGRKAHGVVNLPQALTVSSDVYFYNLGLQYWRVFGRGNESNADLAQPQYGIQRAATQFGFGATTGSGIPGEAKGRVPDLTFKRSLNGLNPDPSTRIWLPASTPRAWPRRCSRAAPPWGSPRSCGTCPANPTDRSGSSNGSSTWSGRASRGRCAPRRARPTRRSPGTPAGSSWARRGPPRCRASFGGSVAAPIARRVFDALNGDPNPPPVRTYPPEVD